VTAGSYVNINPRMRLLSHEIRHLLTGISLE